MNLMSDGAYERYGRICHLVAARGTRLTIQDLGAAAALARELELEAPDPERVAELTARLGLTPEDVAR